MSSSQNPRSATLLGKQTSNYLNSAVTYDNYHDLTYLPANRLLADDLVRHTLLRIPLAGLTLPPFPGSTGNRVISGYEAWTGAAGMFPGMLFMFGEVPSSVWPYPFTVSK